MKIKYKYNIHHLLDNYLTEEDALFDICNFLIERGITGEWSNLTIKPAFRKKLEEEEINSLLLSLVNQGYLNERTGNGKKKYYKLISEVPFDGMESLTDSL